MIYDRVPNICRYKINKNFVEFAEWLNNGLDEQSKPINIKSIHLEYETKEFNLPKFENHQKYIDVHYILEGDEFIGIQDIEKLDPKTEYDEKEDYQLFKGNVEEQFLLKKGDVLVLFSNEVHVTGGSIG